MTIDELHKEIILMFPKAVNVTIEVNAHGIDVTPIFKEKGVENIWSMRTIDGTWIK